MEETIVLYPAPGIGHLISMVELGKQLLAHSHTLSSINILLPSIPLPYHDTITSYISSVSSSFPSITFHSLPPITLHHGDPSAYPDIEAILFESLRNNNPNVLNALKSFGSTSLVRAVVIDFFCYAVLDVSRSLDLPTYFFFSSGASALTLFLNFPVFDRIATDSYRNLNMSFEIPELFAVPATQMIEPMLDRGVSYYEFVKMGETVAKYDGIIINTFEELEERAVKGLKQGTCLPGTNVPPIYCIGPLIASRGKEEGEERHECLSWLDSQPARSVVYLCFGSHGRFSKQQIREIALGLERSGVSFLWVVRTPVSEIKEVMKIGFPEEPDSGSFLPEGFLERTKDRGLVVKSWAPQIAVLGHESIGGFVSHCGWNSTLEAVFAGVPMVAWPLYAEQRFNKIVLVQELRIALPMNESKDRFVSSDEVEKRVKQIVDSEEGDAVRKQVLDLKDKAKAALGEGGSSKVALSMLIKSWKL